LICMPGGKPDRVLIIDTRRYSANPSAVSPQTEISIPGMMYIMGLLP
jgi:hypothetical protein